MKENQAEVQKSIQDANEELHTLKVSQKICTELFTEKMGKKLVIYKSFCLTGEQSGSAEVAGGCKRRIE